MIKTLVAPRVGTSTKAERHAFWIDVIKRYHQSGLTRRDFCQHHDLNRAEFRRWKYRLSHEVITKKTSPTFVPLSIQPDENPKSAYYHDAE